nr:DEP domain-containing mTOR-interacting protein-like [Lytechinus pictus]
MRGKTKSFDGSAVLSLASKSTGNILIIGEKLRNEWRASLIQDRRYRLRHYQKCFIGKDVIDWIVLHKGIKERGKVVELMNVLQKYNVIHHVCDDHLFKDEMLFYRFRVDDRTFRDSRESRTIINGTTIFHRVTSETSSNPLLKPHTEFGHKYPDSFYGAELVSWLLRINMCNSRDAATGLGKDLLEADIIRHVTMDHHFKDERLLYHFNPVMSDLSLTDLMTLDQEATMMASGEAAVMPSLTIPREPQRIHSNSSSSDTSLERASLSGSKPDLGSQDQNQNHLGESSKDLDSPNIPTEPICTRRWGSFTANELRHPESPFTKRHIKIVGDSVGFGLVIRGGGPTYVQTVDPEGPAAAAGLKVKEYLAAVNGTDVLEMNHTDVAKLILANPYELSLDLMILNDGIMGT